MKRKEIIKGVYDNLPKEEKAAIRNLANRLRGQVHGISFDDALEILALIGIALLQYSEGAVGSGDLESNPYSIFKAFTA